MVGLHLSTKDAMTAKNFVLRVPLCVQRIRRLSTNITSMLYSL